jgi:hypothetical protein
MVVFEAIEAKASYFGRTLDAVLTMLTEFGYEFWILRYRNSIPIKLAAEINPTGDPSFWTAWL